jgi:hypothetical protein
LGESRKTESESYYFKAIQGNHLRAANNDGVEFCKGPLGESRKPNQKVIILKLFI